MLTKPKLFDRRSIPACAREPATSQRPAHSNPVYPRVCGGTNGISSMEESSPGLSPRVRGNLRESGVQQARLRSIPACAGEPLRPRRADDLPRSIPACAGEPFIFFRVRQKSWVYPRVCGGTYLTGPFLRRAEGLSPRVRGNRTGCRPTTTGTGLSPRVRGNQRRPSRRSQWHRSIPACAGEPSGVTSTPSRLRVYPRVCGGTGTAPHHMASERGLSPRVRGNLM